VVTDLSDADDGFPHPNQGASAPTVVAVALAADEEHASRGMVPLLVNAAVPAPRPGVAPALAGIATVREVVGAINADFCILANASASISVRDVAGLDELRVSRS
jgi:hypothetical protein